MQRFSYIKNYFYIKIFSKNIYITVIDLQKRKIRTNEHILSVFIHYNINKTGYIGKHRIPTEHYQFASYLKLLRQPCCSFKQRNFHSCFFCSVVAATLIVNSILTKGTGTFIVYKLPRNFLCFTTFRLLQYQGHV